MRDAFDMASPMYVYIQRLNRLRDAYRTHLEGFHNFWLKNTFRAGLSAMPKREEMLQRLAPALCNDLNAVTAQSVHNAAQSFGRARRRHISKRERRCIAHEQGQASALLAEEPLLEAAHLRTGRALEERARGEHRPVVAAAQPQRDRPGDRVADPAGQGLAQHQRLRLQPAPLVEEPAEPAALLLVGRQRVVVVDRRHEPLVGDEQQSHRRGLVRPAAGGAPCGPVWRRTRRGATCGSS